MSNIGIIGAGAWGIALGINAHRNGHNVNIWHYDSKKANLLIEKRQIAALDRVNIPKKINFISQLHEAINCDILIQLLPTSPFLTTEEIDNFISSMIENNYDTLISTKEVKIESLFKNKPLNFDQKKHTPPSQELEPVYAYACGIMGWKSKKFISNMEEFGAAYHGGSGKIGFFELKGLSLIDIDNEEDFQLASLVLKSKSQILDKPIYYNPEKKLIYDSTVSEILKMDGVINNKQSEINKETVSIDDIVKSKPIKESWSHTLINSDSNSATLIGQLPGEGNRMHFHPDWNEWWYIIEGQWEWNIEGQLKKINKGEVVFIEKNRKHKIKAIGDKMSIRLAVSRYDVDHVYVDEDYKK